MKELERVNKPSILVVVEPKISGERAKKVIQKLGFSNHHVADPVGYAGSVCLCWDQSVNSIEVLSSSSQYMNALLTHPTQGQWLFTAVYASPVMEIRSKLW